MPDDTMTTALKELGKTYELSLRLRTQSADMQANSLAMEKAMWRCLSALRRLRSQDAEWVRVDSDKLKRR